MFRQERLDHLKLFVSDREELDARELCGQIVKPREFRDAVATPRCPELDHNRLASQGTPGGVHTGGNRSLQTERRSRFAYFQRLSGSYGGEQRNENEDSAEKAN